MSTLDMSFGWQKQMDDSMLRCLAASLPPCSFQSANINTYTKKNSHSHSHGEGGHGHTHGVIDPTIATTTRGIWAIKWSFIMLGATALFQLVIVYFSGSVALSLLTGTHARHKCLHGVRRQGDYGLIRVRLGCTGRSCWHV